MQFRISNQEAQIARNDMSSMDEREFSNNEKYNVTMTKNCYEQVNSPEEVNSIENKKNKELIQKLNDFLQTQNTHVEYEVHKGFGDIMIKIIDNNTKKVIKEMPPKKILDMVEKLCELSGVMMDKKA